MQTIWDARAVLWAALGTTCVIFIPAALFTLALSFAAGIAEYSRLAWLVWPSRVYGALFRGISLVVQLFWIFYVLPLWGVTLGPQLAAVLALGLCFGAYGAETVRAALQAVPRDQVLAALALGLTPRQCFMSIEFPQALPIMLPPLGNLLVMCLKATSVTAMITVPELSFTANMLAANVGATVEMFVLIAAIYFAMSKLVLHAMARVERFVRIPGTAHGI